MALSDILRPRVCELGKIKIGGKGAERTSSSGKKFRMPEKYDHFVITTLHRNAAGDFVLDRDLMNSLAPYADADGKLRQIPVGVLSNDPDDVMQSAYVDYEGKKVAARSDGVTLTKFYDRKTRTWLETPVEIPWEDRFADVTDQNGNRYFKLHSVLNVAILSPQARWGGFYKFRTTSQISAEQIYGCMDQIRGLTGGILRGFPLRLAVRPMQVTPQGKPTTIYVVHLELTGPDLLTIQAQGLERAKFELDNRKAMEKIRLEFRELIAPPGQGETEEDSADAAETFHPDVTEAEFTPAGVGAGMAAASSPAQSPPASRPDPLAETLGLLPDAARASPGAPAAEADLLPRLLALRGELEIGDDAYLAILHTLGMPDDLLEQTPTIEQQRHILAFLETERSGPPAGAGGNY